MKSTLNELMFTSETFAVEENENLKKSALINDKKSEFSILINNVNNESKLID
jgi:hypothetical protein